MSALKTHFCVPTPREVESPVPGSAAVTWGRGGLPEAGEISWDRQLARLTEWLGQWEAA